MELSFEADECIALSYMDWNRVPKGCICEGEAGFKQVCSGFRQYYGSRRCVTVVTNKKLFEILGCQREWERTREKRKGEAGPREGARETEERGEREKGGERK